MIRNISREDYLLARAANPRTGIITPAAHSANSSIDEVQELKARGLAPPGKWRQRGNQWISLEFGQPTPIPTPTSEAGVPDPTLRTPARLTATKHNHGGTSLQPAKRAEQPVTQLTATAVDTETGLPGSYPETPRNNDGISANTGSIIPRKPVSSPLKTSVLNRTPPSRPGEAAQELDLPPPLPPKFTETGRSSSAPAPWKPYPFCPADVGKDLPTSTVQAAPPQAPADVGSQPNHFLGHSPRTASGAGSTTMANTVKKLDKELPCLPMSNGPSRSPHLPSLSSIRRDREPTRPKEATLQSPDPLLADRTRRQDPAMQKPSTVHGPRETTQSSPYIRRQAALNRPVLQPTGGRAMEVPIYDNPPAPKQESKRRQVPEIRTQNHAARHCQRTIATTFDDILLAPIGISMSTSMNTGISIDMSTGNVPYQAKAQGTQPMSGGTRHQRDRHMTGLVDQGIVHRDGIGMNTSVSSDALMEMQIPVARVRAMPTSRPPMPDRTEAMNTIPRLVPVPKQPRRKGTDTAPSHQWSMIGMPITPNTFSEKDGPGPTQVSAQESNAPILPSRSHKPPDPAPHGPSSISKTNAELPTASSMVSKEDGLYRKCSRCSHGFVQDRDRRTGGRASSNETYQTAQANHLDCVDEHHERTTETIPTVVAKKELAWQPEPPPPRNTQQPTSVTWAPKPKVPVISKTDHDVLVERPITTTEVTASAGSPIDASAKPESGPRRGSENPLVPVTSDDRDHSGCCPQCCKEQDCHEGCIGHPSPSATPVTESSPVETPSHTRSGSITSLEGQPLTPLSERNKKLNFVKLAFRKGFQKSNITNKEAQSPIVSARITRLADLQTMPSELSAGPLSPGTFWGGKGSNPGSAVAAAAAKSALGKDQSQAEPDTGAAEAAKAAIGMKDAVQPKKPAVLIKKTRTKSKENVKAESSHLTSKETKRKVSPNESRRITSPPATVNAADDQDAASVRSLRRANSDASSNKTDDVQLPTTVIGAVAEMAVVPFEVSRMWLRNNPGVSSTAGHIGQRAWTMFLAVLTTSEACWRMVFVYSKTGKWKAPDKDGWGFIWDCVRSTGYVIVLIAVAVLGLRILGCVFGIVRAAFLVVRGILWVVKILLGGGISW